jgi:hypothetical protein
MKISLVLDPLHAGWWSALIVEPFHYVHTILPVEVDVTQLGSIVDVVVTVDVPLLAHVHPPAVFQVLLTVIG